MVTQIQRVDSSAAELVGPLGKYRLYDAISVGMSTSVHVGMLEGAQGVRRTVAIKRFVSAPASEPAAHAELIYEACVGALVHHPNVVAALDVGMTDRAPFLAMEYVLGDSVAAILRSAGRFPVPIAVAIVGDVLRGLHAVHVATDVSGDPLEIVHQNVCPENILVGVDGAARIIDFGASVSTIDSMTLPKPQLLASRVGVRSPEQTMGWPLDGRTDIFAAAVVLWELLAGARPFRNHGAMQGFLSRPTRTMPPASAFNVDVTSQLEAVIDRALSWSPARRFESALQFAEALEATVAPCDRGDVGRFVEELSAERLAEQREILGAIDAPYGGMSSSLPKERQTESAAALAIRRSEDGGAEERTAPWVPLRARFTGRLARLGSVVAQTFRPAPRIDEPSASPLSLAPWDVPAGEAIVRQGSTVLAGLSLVCLLLAATGAIPRSWRRHATVNPSIAVTSAIQADPRLGHDPAQGPLDDECATAPTALAPPAAPGPAVGPTVGGPAIVAAPVVLVASVSAAVASAAPTPVPPAALAPHAPSVLRHDVTAERDRVRAKAAPHREGSQGVDRPTCDPSFTVDEAGARRVKLDCI